MSKIVRLRCRVTVGEEFCGKIAKAGIITVSDYIERQEVNKFPEQGSGLAFWPMCADHAPEEVHEAAASMDESEFLVIELPAFGVGDLT